MHERKEFKLPSVHFNYAEEDFAIRPKGCRSSKFGAIVESTTYQLLNDEPDLKCSGKILAMITPLWHLVGWIGSAFLSRESLILEKLALRQQLLACGSPKRCAATK
jgi:hypothetical protein